VTFVTLCLKRPNARLLGLTWGYGADMIGRHACHASLPAYRLLVTVLSWLALLACNVLEPRRRC
jgi:hypothetical protein